MLSLFEKPTKELGNLGKSSLISRLFRSPYALSSELKKEAFSKSQAQHLTKS